MKLTFTALVLIFCYQITTAQIFESSCEASDSIEMLYHFDAKVLATRAMANDSQYDNTLLIDEELTEFYLQKMLAVYNASNFASGDSVTKCQPIHVFPAASINQFLLSLDTSEDWVQNLVEGVIPTGYAAFDNLYTSLNLDGIFLGNLPNPSIIGVLSTEQCLHLPGVINAFQGLTGVNYVEPDGLFGAGNNVVAETSSSFIDLTYEYGWGDCPSGCIFGHFWKIRVYENCSVEFINSWGDEVDFPCQSIIDGTEEAIIDESITVFPTITNHYLTIEVEEGSGMPNHWSVFSSDGKLLMKGNALENLTLRVDVSKLAAGLHFISLNFENGVVTKRFLKS